jgi:hypothetical protein
MKRRLIAAALTEEMLSVLLREGATMRCMGGIPADASFCGAHNDWARREIVAIFEHSSFALVSEGEEIPQKRVAFEIIEHPQRSQYDVVRMHYETGRQANAD